MLLAELPALSCFHADAMQVQQRFMVAKTSDSDESVKRGDERFSAVQESVAV